MITALPGEAGQAELTTDQGAIYVTNNKAYTWSAAVLETVDATLNRTVSSGKHNHELVWHLASMFSTMWLVQDFISRLGLLLVHGSCPWP